MRHTEQRLYHANVLLWSYVRTRDISSSNFIIDTCSFYIAEDDCRVVSLMFYTLFMNIRTSYITILNRHLYGFPGVGKLSIHYPFDASLTFVLASFLICISKFQRLGHGYRLCLKTVYSLRVKIIYYLRALHFRPLICEWKKLHYIEKFLYFIN